MTIDQQQEEVAFSSDETALLAALRAGDEAAYAAIVERHHGGMLRLARMYVQSASSAEEVVQEAWLGLLTGLVRFEGRSSLKTYLFRIVVNCARTRSRKDGRTIPFSAAFPSDDGAGEAAVPPERFQQGAWAAPPASWAETPERSALSSEIRAVVEAAIASLPASQREVITLRDVEGWAGDEVCNALSISGTNQRVLLHRARSKVRLALERYFAEGRE